MKKLAVLITAAALWLGLLPAAQCSARELIPVGQVVGLELENGTVTVAALEDGAEYKEGGLLPGDVLLEIDGQKIQSGADVKNALARSDGTVAVKFAREGREQTQVLTPRITEDGPKLGIYLRQGVTGIGTVTWFDPEAQTFATLGHGVNDPQGRLLQITGGSCYAARVLTVKKGRSGAPGQLIGSIRDPEPVGVLTANTQQGVFGTGGGWQGTALETASPEEIRAGRATVLSTVTGDTVREYSVEILKIYPKGRQTGRNLLIRVTDPDLLEATGGIVQGMSGSPIIQDGKLVGAVTHVLVNDPTMGYGIFIENMLDAAA